MENIQLYHGDCLEIMDKLIELIELKQGKIAPAGLC